MKIANVHYTGFGGLAAVVNGMVTAPGAAEHTWIMGYYGVAPLDASNRAFCEAHGLKYETFQPLPRRPWSAWRDLVRWLKEERPDAILCHSITAIPPCAYYARKNRIPLIAVEHTPNEVKSRTEWAGSIASMFFAHRVVVLTKVYSGLLQAGLGRLYCPAKVRTIPNGVDAGMFRPIADIVSNGKLCAGMAARLANTKRHAILLEAARDTGLTLRFAGDGECLEGLKSRASQIDESLVQFDGLVPADRMPNWLGDLDIYLHASEGETFSMSVLQAMATGLPVIASDISGMDEIIGRDGRCGLLVPNTKQAWRSAIELLAGDAELRKRMGQAARARVEKEFSTATMLDGYLQVIKEVTNR